MHGKQVKNVKELDTKEVSYIDFNELVVDSVYECKRNVNKPGFEYTNINNENIKNKLDTGAYEFAKKTKFFE